jgi:hypothetical protein
MSLDFTEALARVVDGGQFPQEAVNALRAEGLFGLLGSTDVGGRGGTLADAFTVVHALGTVCGSASMVACMHYCGAAVIEKVGDTPTRQAVARGEHLSTLAFSEAGSRSHFWAPVSTARAEGDRVVLDARKSWVTSASHATAYVWSSQPVAAEGPSTLWLVPGTVRGLSVPAAQFHVEALVCILAVPPFRGLSAPFALTVVESSPTRGPSAPAARRGRDGLEHPRNRPLLELRGRGPARRPAHGSALDARRCRWAATKRSRRRTATLACTAPTTCS